MIALPILTLLTEAQVADLLGLSIRTLQAWRLNGGGPPFVRLADDGKRGTVRYRQQDVAAYIESRSGNTPLGELGVAVFRASATGSTS